MDFFTEDIHNTFTESIPDLFEKIGSEETWNNFGEDIGNLFKTEEDGPSYTVKWITA